MNLLGNILWLLFGGIITALLYFICGLVMCITIIGIPFGVQLFKLGAFSLMPFGHDVSSNGVQHFKIAALGLLPFGRDFK